MIDTFTCAECKETFEKDRTDEEAMTESHQEFGYNPPENLVVICHDCYLVSKSKEDIVKKAAAPKISTANIDPIILNIIARMIAKEIIGT